MRLTRRDLGMKILGISGKEAVGFSPSLRDRQEYPRAWIHGMRTEVTLRAGRSIPEGMDPWNEG